MYGAGLAKGWSAAVVNRGLADASMVLLGTALVLGVLSRLYNAFDKFLTYRKEIGIMAFFSGAAHVYLAMFPLARRGPWGFYESRPWSAFPGLLGLGLMFLLFVISFKAVEEKLSTLKKINPEAMAISIYDSGSLKKVEKILYVIEAKK